MNRITITLSAEAREIMEKTQKMLSEQLGGARVMPGYAIGYALKQLNETGKLNEKEEK